MTAWSNYATQMLAENVLLFDFANRRIHAVTVASADKGLSKAQAIRAVASEVEDIFVAGYHGAITDYPILDTVIPSIDELEIDYDQIAGDILRNYAPSGAAVSENSRQKQSKGSSARGKGRTKSKAPSKGSKTAAKGRRRDAPEVS